jgi:hypothetical protein
VLIEVLVCRLHPMYWKTTLIFYCTILFYLVLVYTTTIFVKLRFHVFENNILWVVFIYFSKYFYFNCLVMVFWKAHACSQHKKVIKYQALIDGLCFFLMNSIRNFVYAEMMVCLIQNSDSLDPLVFLGRRGSFYWDCPHSLTNSLTHAFPAHQCLSIWTNLKFTFKGNLQIQV